MPLHNAPVVFCAVKACSENDLEFLNVGGAEEELPVEVRLLDRVHVRDVDAPPCTVGG